MELDDESKLMYFRKKGFLDSIFLLGVKTQDYVYLHVHGQMVSWIKSHLPHWSALQIQINIPNPSCCGQTLPFSFLQSVNVRQ